MTSTPHNHTAMNSITPQQQPLYHRSHNHRHRHRSKRPRRGCVYELARLLAVEQKRTVIITGAGLSVASGVRPFRGAGGVWNSVIYEQSTRQAFRKNPLEWYNKFWLPQFVSCYDNDEESEEEASSTQQHQPNAGHTALESICKLCPSAFLITQNIDGLHRSTTSSSDMSPVIEAHGRLGLYKCIPDSDSDTDSDSDEDDDRLVHLGHRRKSRALRRAYYKSLDKKMSSSENGNGGVQNGGTLAPITRANDDSASGDESDDASLSDASNDNNKTRVPCRYELVDSISVNDIQPPSVRQALLTNSFPLTQPPQCPACHRPCPPQALLFDEGYHSHDHYQFEKMEHLLSTAQVIIFVGTSFSGVRITQVALEHARSVGIKVFNFNTKDMLPHSNEWHVQNVVGPAQETLPRLLQACRELLKVEESLHAITSRAESDQSSNEESVSESSSSNEDEENEKAAVVSVNVNKKRRRDKRERDPIMLLASKRRCLDWGKKSMAETIASWRLFARAEPGRASDSS